MVCGVSLLTTGREMFTVTFTRIYKVLAALVPVKNEVFKLRRGISYLSVTVESLSLSHSLHALVVYQGRTSSLGSNSREKDGVSGV